MKKTNVIIIGLSILISSCTKPCVEPRGIEGAGLTISFFNTTNNEYFYPENANLSPYKIDSLRVKDSNGKLLTTPCQRNLDPRNPLKAFYVVGIYPIFIPSDDQAAYNMEQTNLFILSTTPTLSIKLRLVYKAAHEKCANKYEYIEAYYKNNLIAESYNSYSQGLLFTLKH
jgi:hypothetical protein